MSTKRKKGIKRLLSALLSVALVLTAFTLSPAKAYAGGEVTSITASLDGSLTTPELDEYATTPELNPADGALYEFSSSFWQRYVNSSWEEFGGNKFAPGKYRICLELYLDPKEATWGDVTPSDVHIGGLTINEVEISEERPEYIKLYTSDFASLSGSGAKYEPIEIKKIEITAKKASSASPVISLNDKTNEYEWSIKSVSPASIDLEQASIFATLFKKNDDLYTWSEYSPVYEEGEYSYPTIEQGTYRWGLKIDLPNEFGNVTYADDIAINVNGEKWVNATADYYSYGCAYYYISGPWYMVSDSGTTVRKSEWSVSCELNGGSWPEDVSVENMTIPDGKCLSELPTPVKEGYTFGGWFTDSALKNSFSFSTPITEDTTLYAKWTASSSKPIWTITLELNGGKTTGKLTIQAPDGAYGFQNDIPDPTKEGYTFAGWYLDSSFNTKADLNAELKKNTTFYAKWTANSSSSETKTWTVTFNRGDYGETTTEKVENGKYTAWPPTNIDGYMVLGWFTDKELKNFFYFDKTPITSDITLYAWIAKTVNFTYELNGGEFTERTQNPFVMNQGGKVNPRTAEKTGYLFGGWYTDSKFTAKFDFTKQIKEDTTVYARWIEPETKDAVPQTTTATINGKEVEVKLEIPASILDNIAATENVAVADLTIKPEVEKKDEESVSGSQKERLDAENARAIDSNSDLQKAKQKDASAIVTDFFEIGLAWFNGANKGGDITEVPNGKLVEVAVPFDFTGKYYPVVTRDHHNDTTGQDETTMFKQLTTKPDVRTVTENSFFADTTNSRLYLYSDGFSTFSITYSTKKNTTTYYGGGGYTKVEEEKPAISTSTYVAPAPVVKTVPVYRLYNPKTGEHFFTITEAEKETIIAQGFVEEGVAFTALSKSSTPVYRLFNTLTGEHYFVGTEAAAKAKEDATWKIEGIAWFAPDKDASTVYRMINPNAKRFGYHYTSNPAEKEFLEKLGWKSETAGFLAK